MATHHDLWLASRARMRLLEHEIAEIRRTKMASPARELVGRRRITMLRPDLLAADALHLLSTLLLSISRRLECYAERLLARAGSSRLEERVGSPC